MSRIKPWFKFNDDAFLSATLGWPGDLKGFYALLIILRAAKHGKLPDDLRLISHATGYRPTTCERLLEALVFHEKLTRFDGSISFFDEKSVKTPGQPIEKIESGIPKPIRRRRVSLKERPKGLSLLEKSAGARVGEMEAPVRAAPPEKKRQEDRIPSLTEEERAQFVRQMLGREVLPGRVEGAAPFDISDFPDAPRK